MTEDEIRGMKAGREMDALVVSYIMGLIWWRRGLNGQWIALPEHDTEIPDYWIRDTPPRGLTEDDLSEAVPHYSTDIAAAWQVVEKMLGSGLDFSMANTENLAEFQWGVDFYIMIDEAAVAKIYSTNAPTAPLAVCRAALLAVMDEAHGP